MLEEKRERHEEVLQIQKVRHIMKDCKEKQLMKKRSIQEESDNKDNKDKQKGFGEGLK